MKILGLLQNTWVRDPARVKAALARNPAHRRRLLARLLFAGSPTGRCLRSVFGDWCERIEWENADPSITNRPNVRVAGNPAHLAAVLCDVGPDVVIAFGTVARTTLARTAWDGPSIYAPHPVARGPGVLEDLRGARRQLDKLASEDVRG